jgi:hypothetical protein
LFYLDGKALIAVEIDGDGAALQEPTVHTPITVVTNWSATLRWHGELTRLARRRRGVQQ